MHTTYLLPKTKRKLKNYSIYAVFLIFATVSGNTPVSVFYPKSVCDLVNYVKNSSMPLSIIGTGYGQGGQTVADQAVQIDMRHMCYMTFFDVTKKQITVPSRTTWRQVQECIDKYDLSLKVMQSYNDFSIGGSIGVNAHGRDLQGQIITSILELTILLADGTLVKASRDEHYDLFRAAIGGYGLVGIIIDATLQLTDNVSIRQETALVPREQYKDFFEQNIRDNENIQLHNAVIYPHDFNNLISHAWIKTNNPTTIDKRLQPNSFVDYAKDLFAEQLVRRIPALHSARPIIEPKLHNSSAVVRRNYEMSYTVKSVLPLVDFLTTSILQEYFIPTQHFESFIKDLERIKKQHAINIMNISIRFVPENQESLLSYAPTDRFAVVLYMDVLNPRLGFSKTEQWTQKLIDAALSYGGTYYLPYALYATKEQFQTSYPRIDEFVAVKKQYDPNNRFTNTLWQKYMAQEV